MSRFNSFLTTARLIAPALTYAQTPSHRSGDPKISVDQVSFYAVPLACPAARGLGCGFAAKPALLSFEKKRSIQEAWLDHAGTTLAIAWENGTKADTRLADIQSVADDRGLSLHEITGERRDETSKSFLSRTGWYRDAEVDRLSEEEAGVIVERLVHRAIAERADDQR